MKRIFSLLLLSITVFSSESDEASQGSFPPPISLTDTQAHQAMNAFYTLHPPDAAARRYANSIIATHATVAPQYSNGEPHIEHTQPKPLACQETFDAIFYNACPVHILENISKISYVKGDEPKSELINALSQGPSPLPPHLMPAQIYTHRFNFTTGQCTHSVFCFIENLSFYKTCGAVHKVHGKRSTSNTSTFKQELDRLTFAIALCYTDRWYTDEIISGSLCSKHSQNLPPIVNTLRAIQKPLTEHQLRSRAPHELTKSQQQSQTPPSKMETLEHVK